MLPIKSFSYSITQKVIRREQAMKDVVFSRKLFRNIDGQQKVSREEKKTTIPMFYVFYQYLKKYDLLIIHVVILESEINIHMTIVKMYYKLYSLFTVD